MKKFLSVLLFLFFINSVRALPQNFEVQDVATGLNIPTSLAISSDGRIFVAEKNGAVRLIKNNLLISTPVINLTDINTYGDRGLIGIALDPDFNLNGYMYLSYTYENTPGINLTGPKTARIVRVTVVGDVSSESSKIVLVGTEGGNKNFPSCTDFPIGTDCIPSDSSGHSAGALRFGNDGKLYATTGDGSLFDKIDIKALRSQDLNILSGKLLRINKDGTAPSDNPFFDGSATSTRSKVYAYGFRNPFRLNFHPNGSIFIGDVGWGTKEELDKIIPGGNYGWPCKEGNLTTTYNCTATNSLSSVYEYFHDANNAGSITGGAFATSYPATYTNAMFFGDYAQNWIKILNLDSNGNFVSVENFLDGAGGANGPVEFVRGNDGNIYFISIYTGSVRKIIYNTGNRAPIAQINSDVMSGSLPLTVNFSASSSADPDGDGLTYLWDFGDGATSTNTNVSHVFTIAGEYNVSLTVKDTGGAISQKILNIKAGNQKPIINILTPQNGSLYLSGQNILATATATDPEDGILPDSAFTWTIILHHNIHTHILQSGIGKNYSFLGPDHSGATDIYTEIKLRVTDSTGLFDEKSIYIYNNNVSTAYNINLVLNPNLELPESGQTFPTYWQIDSWGQQTATYTHTFTGRNGGRSIRTTVSSYTNGDAKVWANTIDVVPGGKYRYSSYYKSDVNTKNMVKLIRQDTSSYWLYLNDNATSSDWKFIERYFTIPNDVVNVRVYQALEKVGFLEIDDVNLELLENTPPTVSITSPIENDLLGGLQKITALANDNATVTKVDLYLDGNIIATKNLSPFEFIVDTNLYNNGMHYFNAVARDLSNNYATTTNLNIYFSNIKNNDLILNGNLETASGTLPKYWTPSPWGNSSTTYSYTNTGRNGGKSIKIETSNFISGDSKWKHKEIEVYPGDVYTYSVFYKCSTSSDMFIKYKNKNGVYSLQYFSKLAPVTDWTRVEKNITIPIDIVTVEFYQSLSSNGYLELDDISFTASPYNNLIKNGNFEIASGTLAKYWSNASWGTNMASITNPSTGYLGGKSLKIVTNSYINGDVKVAHSEIPVVKGETYKYTAMYKSSTTTDLTLMYKNLQGINTFEYFDKISATSTWAKIEKNFVVPIGVTTLTVLHSLFSLGNIELDNVELRLVPQLTSTTTNLILNGNLEVTNGANPLNWDPAPWGVSSSTYTYANSGRNGGRSIRIDTNNFVSGDAKWGHAIVGVTPNATYTYASYLKSSTITDLFIKMKTSSGTISYLYFDKIPATSTWSYISKTFLVPVNLVFIQIYHALFSSGSLEIDDVSLIKN